MNSKLLKIGLPALFLGLCLCGYLQLRQANARLRTQIAAAQARTEPIARVRADNQRLQTLVERAKIDAGDGRRALQDETERARREVADLEQQAEAKYEAKVAKDRATREALATNRDLTKGPVLLENCRDAGRATPVDTLQTLIWASVKGDDERVASMIVLDKKSRVLIAALLASLPSGEQEKYPTPEKLAALVFADMMMNISAVQVTAQKAIDSQRVVLTIGKLSGKTVDVVMEPGTNGWQVVTADRKIFDQFKARVVGPSPAAMAGSK